MPEIILYVLDISLLDLSHQHLTGSCCGNFDATLCQLASQEKASVPIYQNFLTA